MMSGLRPFHLAVPVHDLAFAKSFYGGLLGCAEGGKAGGTLQNTFSDDSQIFAS